MEATELLRAYLIENGVHVHYVRPYAIGTTWKTNDGREYYHHMFSISDRFGTMAFRDGYSLNISIHKPDAFEEILRYLRSDFSIGKWRSRAGG